MAATMRQVADLAGVSLKSVSRVVNGEPNVSDELRRKVKAAIDQLDWRPNAMARTLRTGRTETVAVVVPDMRSGWVSALTQALVIEADRRGLRTAIEPCGRDGERAAHVLAEQATSFDGAIVVGGIHGEDTSPAAEWPLPVCRVGAFEAGGAPSADGGVGLDLEQAADAVARHLRALRLTTPAVVGPRPDRPGSFAHALRRALNAPSVVETAAVPSRAEGFRLAAELALLVDRHDAVALADDELALGALAGLRSRGIRVPQQIALCGCGGLEDGRFSSPSLTTLAFPAGEIARIALDDLQRRWEPGSRSGVITPVGATLIRRESTLGFTSTVPLSIGGFRPRRGEAG
ncbi:DNA-binding transcriptional regulator, LacI/PurR family [Actinomyces ruminicola]|uniref:DNA-binding transcriptional regulator, LacI/PurR family n=1 Tax=Actinomyces ruminicola TaxID=332524 RepID=A0A1H0BEC3_9ACTO|nr:LacI family DNA-binding transcriptional regulator [Actinomyces ruminicola]SDN44000.1 DNA-binding transcriptional regulator, LacI/PurR family [Actinomyces ruminicola]